MTRFVLCWLLFLAIPVTVHGQTVTATKVPEAKPSVSADVWAGLVARQFQAPAPKPSVGSVTVLPYDGSRDILPAMTFPSANAWMPPSAWLPYWAAGPNTISFRLPREPRPTPAANSRPK